MKDNDVNVKWALAFGITKRLRELEPGTVFEEECGCKSLYERRRGRDYLVTTIKGCELHTLRKYIYGGHEGVVPVNEKPPDD